MIRITVTIIEKIVYKLNECVCVLGKLTTIWFRIPSVWIRIHWSLDTSTKHQVGFGYFFFLEPDIQHTQTNFLDLNWTWFTVANLGYLFGYQCVYVCVFVCIFEIALNSTAPTLRINLPVCMCVCRIGYNKFWDSD